MQQPAAQQPANKVTLNPILLVEVLRIFTLRADTKHTPRWNGRGGGPAPNSVGAGFDVELQDAGLVVVASDKTDAKGMARLNLKGVPDGKYTLHVEPPLNQRADDATGKPVQAGPTLVVPRVANSNDPPAGLCLYRALDGVVQIASEAVDTSVAATVDPPSDIHGDFFIRSAGSILVDLKPDFIESPNHLVFPSHNARSQEMVILHRTSGGPAVLGQPNIGPAGIDGFMVQQSLSAHYLVDVDGHVVMMVPQDLPSNHVGASLFFDNLQVRSASIGIEILNSANNNFRSGTDYPPAQQDAVVDLVSRIRFGVTPNIRRRHILGH